jgi:hypothetical protein
MTDSYFIALLVTCSPTALIASSARVLRCPEVTECAEVGAATKLFSVPARRLESAQGDLRVSATDGSSEGRPRPAFAPSPHCNFGLTFCKAPFICAFEGFL